MFNFKKVFVVIVFLFFSFEALGEEPKDGLIVSSVALDENLYKLTFCMPDRSKGSKVFELPTLTYSENGKPLLQITIGAKLLPEGNHIYPLVFDKTLINEKLNIHVRFPFVDESGQLKTYYYDVKSIINSDVYRALKGTCKKSFKVKPNRVGNQKTIIKM